MFLIDHKLSLGEQIAGFADWLTLHGTSLFDKTSDTLEFLIYDVTNDLLRFNPLVLIALLVGLMYFIRRSQGLAVFALASLLLIPNLGYWQEAMEALAQVISVTLVCIAVGVPLGVVVVHKPWFYIALRPLLGLVQAVSTFVYLIPTLALSGLGVVPGLTSTATFATAVPIRLTCLGIQDMPAELLDAGRAFGCSRWQLLTRIELPHAMPSVTAGITQCVMLSLSMMVVAVLVGVDGPSKPVVNVLNTADTSLDFEADLAIVLPAILPDRACKQRAAKGK